MKRLLLSILVLLLAFLPELNAQGLTDLIPISTATHTAVQNGSWFSGSTWDTGTVPGDASIVVIPTGKTVNYSGLSSPFFVAPRLPPEVITI